MKYFKIITILAISLLMLCNFVAHAQTSEKESFTLYTHDDDIESKVSEHYCCADIDMDGVVDTLRYDINKPMFIFSLSAHNFVPYIIEYYDLREGGDRVTISAVEGGFDIFFHNMRSWSKESYIYDFEQKRFRLAHVWHENYGNAANDGSGTHSLDLLTGEFAASVSFYDYEIDRLIPYPEVNMYVENEPVYLDDSTELYMPDYEFFDAYRKDYIAPYIDTVKFLLFNEDYDYAQLVGEKDGDWYSNMVAWTEEPHKGDVLELQIVTTCYQEVASKDIFYVREIISDITVIQEGKLSQFYKSNRKPIHYSGVHTNYWRYETRCPKEVDYFLANTKHKSILKYLKKTGSFEIEFIEYEGVKPEADILAEIKHEHNGRTLLLCKLLLNIDGDVTNYYFFDEVKQAYVPWED